MSRERPSGPRSYRPGRWFGIFGPRTTVLLPPSEKPRVAGLWELIDGGAGFEETLDALIAPGLRGLPGFVLVARSDALTRVVVRGPTRATFMVGGERVEVDGSGPLTWVERALTGVTAMSVATEDTEDTEGGPDLLIGDGLVRVARVDQPAYACDEPLPAQPGPPSASRSPIAPPAVQDHDGMTRSGGPTPGEFAREQPGIPGQPQAPSVTARPVARLALSSGETIDVDRVVLVGRAPEARRFTPADQPRLVTVASPQQEISATHLEIRPGSGADHGSAVVTDLGSTNGTVLEQPGLGTEDLQPGIAVQLIPGAIIDLGDGVTIRVTNPDRSQRSPADE